MKMKNGSKLPLSSFIVSHQDFVILYECFQKQLHLDFGRNEDEWFQLTNKRRNQTTKG